MMYFEKSDSDHFYNLQDKQTVSRDHLRSKGPLAKDNVGKFKKMTDYSVTSSPALITSPQVIVGGSANKLLSGVPDYQWYKGCAPTSGANLIKWWDNNGKGSLVSSTTSSSSLISTLAQYMMTDSSGGTTVTNIKYGLLTYIRNKGYTADVTSIYSPSYGDFTNSIRYGKPNLVTTANHPTYGDHCMTGVGYDDGSSYRDIIVHDTWDTTTTNVYLSWNSYFDYVINVDVY